MATSASSTLRHASSLKEHLPGWWCCCLAEHQRIIAASLTDVVSHLQLTADKQRSIAEELDRTPGEVLKKLEDIRNKIL